jgi:hypothetical protein
MQTVCYNISGKSDKLDGFDHDSVQVSRDTLSQVFIFSILRKIMVLQIHNPCAIHQSWAQDKMHPTGLVVLSAVYWAKQIDPTVNRWIVN